MVIGCSPTIQDVHCNESNLERFGGDTGGFLEKEGDPGLAVLVQRFAQLLHVAVGDPEYPNPEPGCFFVAEAVIPLIFAQPGPGLEVEGKHKTCERLFEEYGIE